MTPARRPNLALATAALIGPALATVGVALTVAARDRLPDRIAVHWGWSGAPDRWASVVGATVTAAAMTVVVPLVLVAIGAVLHPSGRGPLAGVAAGIAVFVGGLGFGGLLSQRSGDVPDGFPAAWMAPAGALAVALGLALARWGRFRPPPLSGTRPPLPEDASRFDVAPTTQLVWTGRAALPKRGVLAIAGLVVLPLLLVALFGQAWVMLLALALALLLAVTYSAQVVIDRHGVRVSSMGLTWTRVPLERVASAEAGTVSPLRDFGGWGWRMGRDGRRAYVTRAGEALVVQRIGEPPVVVTIDDADEAAAVLNTLAARVR